MSSLDLARWQFGIVTVYHYVFVPLTLGLSVAWRRKVGGPLASIENELFACRSRREREGTGGASSKVGLKSVRFSADLACLANGKVDIEGFLRDWLWG